MRDKDHDWPADRVLAGRLQEAIATAWRLGWQPCDVVWVVSRRCGARDARMAIDMIAAQMRRYAVATVDDRWKAQLTTLGAQVWWSDDDRYLREWSGREGLGHDATVGCALRLLSVLSAFPAMARLCPPPGEAGAGPRADGSGHEGRPHTHHSRSRHTPDERLLGRVRALLAKAESTEFAEEAQALSARAQELMTRYGIEQALAASPTPGEPIVGGAAGPAGRRFGVGSPYAASKTALLDVVATVNRCRVVWHRDLALCTVVGFAADLDAVDVLFTSLLAQATAAMVAAGPRRDRHGRSRTRRFRRSFLSAYAQRIGERLGEAADAARREAQVKIPGTDLMPVLAARDRAVCHTVETLFPELTGPAVISAGDREGWALGRTAADLASLSGRVRIADADGPAG